MKLSIMAICFLSTSAYASVNVCTEELKIKTLQNYVNTELQADYKVDEASKNLVSETLGDLVLSTEDDFIIAEGYVGECSGGSVWGRVGIKASNKVLATGLCEVVDTQFGGMCED